MTPELPTNILEALAGVPADRWCRVQHRTYCLDRGGGQPTINVEWLCGGWRLSLESGPYLLSGWVSRAELLPTLARGLEAVQTALEAAP